MTRWMKRSALRGARGDAGMSTAEYAVGTIAAAALAAVLYQVLTSDTVVSLLRGTIEQAFSGPL